MTWSMPGISSGSGNMSPQSMAITSSPDSTSIMLSPISPSPPSGISRTAGSLAGGGESTQLLFGRQFIVAPGLAGPELCRTSSPPPCGEGPGVGHGCGSEGGFGLQAGDEGPGVAQEFGALARADRLARNELLAERVDPDTVLGDPVIEVGAGGQPRHPHVAGGFGLSSAGHG